MKLHEYLACGKPVVVTPPENLLEFANALRFAESDDDWIREAASGIRDAGLNPSAIAERLKVPRDSSWNSRVATIRTLLTAELAARRHIRRQTTLATLILGASGFSRGSSIDPCAWLHSESRLSKSVKRIRLRTAIKGGA